jgi:hypothetical protein
MRHSLARPFPDVQPASPGLRCEKCGADLRLVGIEDHQDDRAAELSTYQCDACRHLQTGMAPESGAIRDGAAMWVFLDKSEVTFERETVNVVVAAFDDAWQRLLAGGISVRADDEASVRERLAKYIIEAAKAGERDPRRLREDALLHFSRASLRAPVAEQANSSATA